MNNNWHIVLSSIVLSIIIWASISLSREFYTTLQVPLQLVNIPEGYMLAQDPPETIKLRLRGSGWKLASLSMFSDVAYRGSLGGQTGETTIELDEFVELNSWVSSGMTMVDINPAELEFSIEKIDSALIPVDVTFTGSYRNGFGSAKPHTVEPDSVMVFGTRSTLEKLRSAVTRPIEFSDLDTKTTMQVSLQPVSGLHFQTSKVDITLHVQRIVEKEIANVPITVTGTPPDRQVNLKPNEVTLVLRGGIDLLSGISVDSVTAITSYNTILRDTVGSIQPGIIVPDYATLLDVRPARIRYIIKKY